jgi:hypothetical protein
MNVILLAADSDISALMSAQEESNQTTNPETP